MRSDFLLLCLPAHCMIAQRKTMQLWREGFYHWDELIRLKEIVLFAHGISIGVHIGWLTLSVWSSRVYFIGINMISINAFSIVWVFSWWSMLLPLLFWRGTYLPTSLKLDKVGTECEWDGATKQWWALNGTEWQRQRRQILMTTHHLLYAITWNLSLSFCRCLWINGISLNGHNFTVSEQIVILRCTNVSRFCSGDFWYLVRHWVCDFSYFKEKVRWNGVYSFR